jgi:thiosulfate reductase cytochrome b subunit
MSAREVKIYSRFERFWHWSQMGLIVTLLISGFGLRGTLPVLSFNQAVLIHTSCALLLIGLWVFAVFWHLTTGTWRHYTPTVNGLIAVIRFYAIGILRGERHPYRKAYWRKHNPAQALTYLALKLVIFPTIWFSGMAYLLYPLWEGWVSSALALTLVATIHVLAAAAILMFIVVHVYLLTIGGMWHHIKPMITGFDEVDLSSEEAAYLEQDEPDLIR